MDGNFDKVEEFDRDVYTVTVDMAVGDACFKLRSVGYREGIFGYAMLYRWFTEISGLGLAVQANNLTRKGPPTREDYMADIYIYIYIYTYIYIYIWVSMGRRA